MAKEQLKTIDHLTSNQNEEKHLNGNGSVQKAENTSPLPINKNGKEIKKQPGNTSKKIKKFIEHTGPAKKETAPAKKTSKKTVLKKIAPVKTTRLIFQLKFFTKPGDNLFITGDHEIFGNKEISKALPLQYLNEQMWVATIDIDAASVPENGITYNYLLNYADGENVYDWGSDKKIDKSILKYEEVLINDTWNHAGYFQNAFYTEPFQNVLLKKSFTEVKVKRPKKFHTYF